ncbi:hypothetical protein TRVL_08530 [Trypanosoma vivax]|nr:hypothetical protein TRVL_08530 [Trypanosoma vivax]
MPLHLLQCNCRCVTQHYQWVIQPFRHFTHGRPEMASRKLHCNVTDRAARLCFVPLSQLRAHHTCWTYPRNFSSCTSPSPMVRVHGAAEFRCSHALRCYGSFSSLR